MSGSNRPGYDPLKRSRKLLLNLKILLSSMDKLDTQWVLKNSTLNDPVSDEQGCKLQTRLNHNMARQCNISLTADVSGFMLYTSEEHKRAGGFLKTTFSAIINNISRNKA